MSHGFFLVLEGPEGAGKTTLAAALEQRFRAAGHETLRVREPGGTPAGEELRKVLLNLGGVLEAGQELLFVTAARGVHVMQVIRPALERGAVVLCDRFDLSTLAYQGAGRGLPMDQVTWVNRCATGGLTPDLTLVLDLPPGVGLQRQVASGKSRDRLDRESAEFHDRVAAYYLAARGKGLVHLDATLAPAALAEEAWNAVLAARPALALAGAR